MKKIFISFLLVLLFTFFMGIKTSFAKEATSSSEEKTSESADSTDSANLIKAQKIMEMVASKAADLKWLEKKGLLGNIKEVSNTQITFEDLNKNVRIIDIDELTKFEASSSAVSSFGISDLKKNDLFSFIGLYNKETKRLLARFAVQKNTLPVQFEGMVLDKDKTEFTLKVVDEEGKTKTIEVETSTRTKSYDKDKNAVKSGFSKIETGERIIANGFYDLKDKNKIIADRIIHFLNLPPSSQMLKYKDLESVEVQVSTGSGKKLSPITN